jgi:hypothetical protein
MVGFASQRKCMPVSPTIESRKHLRLDAATIAAIRPALKKSVSFSTIQLREHEMILGDSVPSCGAPITIEWEARSESLLQVDQYESDRPERRHRREMVIPSKQRMQL